eukprot:400271-Amphidinium_carterae.1
MGSNSRERRAAERLVRSLPQLRNRTTQSQQAQRCRKLNWKILQNSSRNPKLYNIRRTKNTVHITQTSSKL